MYFCDMRITPGKQPSGLWAQYQLTLNAEKELVETAKKGLQSKRLLGTQGKKGRRPTLFLSNRMYQG